MINKAFSVECRDCPRLASFLDEVKARHPDYYAKPVTPFGDAAAKLLIVGLAPGMHGANRTGRPFTGDYAGILLYETLHRFGFATQPTSITSDDGLKLTRCKITNAVKCLPPQNKPDTAEIKQCNKYLKDELKFMSEKSIILALGNVAHRAVLLAFGLKVADFPFSHGARHVLPQGMVLYDSYHCSRYNTQTRRLTADMFHAVFDDISKELQRN